MHSKDITLLEPDKDLHRNSEYDRKINILFGVNDMAQPVKKEEKATKMKRKESMKIITKKEKTQAVKKEQNAAKKKRKELMKIIEEKEKQIQELKDENETIRKNFQIQMESNTFIDEKWKSDIESLQNTLNRMHIMEKQESALKEAYDGEILKSKLQIKQIYDLQREREELLNRFSKLAGGILAHDNTNLTDLSDVDRPTKLSKAYSELYDNEWTDAFEELTDSGLTEHDAIGRLLEIILVSFHKCRQLTWNRYQSLKSSISNIDIVHISPIVGEFSETEVQGYTDTSPLSDGHAAEVRNRRKEKHLTSQMTLSTEQEREIKCIWRTTTKALKQEAVKHLYTVLLTSFDIPIKDLLRTSRYLTSCIDLCWNMGVQEKPMYLDTVPEKNGGSGMIFDFDKFRAYTKSGERVDFIVWPALFLHEGGPILVRGIAQGCNKSDS